MFLRASLPSYPRRRRKRWYGLYQVLGVTLGTFAFVGICLLLQSPPEASLGADYGALGSGRGSRSLLQSTELDVDTDNPTTTSLANANETLEGDGEADEALFPEDLFTIDQRRKGAIILHIFGMIYMFVALAIVCDEFFVPSLDVIIEKAQISEDVAGATFMAAGGSAPELFTSVIGVFISFDDVGIGTIVGSAVFNILFVIGMCVIFSKTVLDLTWWPLFRDITFYSVSLLVLVFFFLDSMIFWYEALILFLIYCLYCLFMKFNAGIEMWVKKHLYKNKVTRVSSTDQLVPNHAGIIPAVAPGVPRAGRRASHSGLHSSTKFRHGLLQLMIHTIDPLHDGKVDEKATQLHAIASLKVLLDATKPQNGRVETYRSDGVTPSSAASDARPETQSHVSGLSSQGTDMTQVDSVASSEVVSTQLNGDLVGVGDSVSTNNVSYAPSQKAEAAPNPLQATAALSPEPERALPPLMEEDEDEPQPLDLSWPSTARKRLTYLFVAPLIIVLWLTLPDTRTPRGKRFFMVTFFGSIVWIAAFSYLMVWWATVVGKTISIPAEVMGLTILAAGTSVPDLITSVIVARKGFGDMAVSSSIGSNIFDVCCGLPIPWLLYALGQFVGNFMKKVENPYDVKPIEVNSAGMTCSVLLLFLMLMFVLLAVICSRWKMSKGLGAFMFILYFVFVGISLSFEYDILICIF